MQTGRLLLPSSGEAEYCTQDTRLNTYNSDYICGGSLRSTFSFMSEPTCFRRTSTATMGLLSSNLAKTRQELA